MRSEDRERYLQAFDQALKTHGFRRRRNGQEWNVVAESERLWVHLNFGLSVVNISLGVMYLDVDKRWPSLASQASGTMVALGSLFEPVHMYTACDDAQAVADLSERGISELTSLTDREHVLARLNSPAPRDWPVASHSHRIRLAPLLLAAAGRHDEALSLSERFASESVGSDQLVPRYPAFLDSLRRELGAEGTTASTPTRFDKL